MHFKYSLELSSGRLEICIDVALTAGQTRMRVENLSESFLTLMSRSNENKSCMRVSEYSHQLSLNFEPVQN